MGDTRRTEPTERTAPSERGRSARPAEGTGRGRRREHPRPRRRLPDEVRTAAVRAWLAFAVTFVCLMVTVLASLAGAWVFLPSLLVTALGVLASTWSLLDIWIARQISAQRDWGTGTATAWANAAGAGRPRRRRRHPHPV